MKTFSAKPEMVKRSWYVVDAQGKTLGRLATEVSKLLRGKETSFYTPGVDQGNYVVILNANQITVSGNKETDKLYYRHSQRPGSLKIETFKQVKERIPTRILEKAVWGMLPKGKLGRQYYRRLYIYSDDKINYMKGKNVELISDDKWIKVEV